MIIKIYYIRIFFCADHSLSYRKENQLLALIIIIIIIEDYINVLMSKAFIVQTSNHLPFISVFFLFASQFNLYYFPFHPQKKISIVSSTFTSTAY